MFSPLFALLIASEFCYYLLIAQTGIVELFHSDIHAFFTLPLGGVIGSLIAYKSVKGINDDIQKLTLALMMQLFGSLFYPQLNLVLLGCLGLSLGMSAPLLIKLSKGRYAEMAFALGVTYAVATALFTYSPLLRGNLAIVLSLLALFSCLFLEYIPQKERLVAPQHVSLYAIVAMAVWAFLDANLFETLSRSSDIAIWRMETWPIILLFHIIGMAAAYVLRDTLKAYHSFIIAFLFALSYALYAMHEAVLLSMVYPFVISYYNFVILKRLLKQNDLKRLGIIMVFTGWIAGGGGLMSALLGYSSIGVVFIALLLSVEIALFTFQFSKKDQPC